MEPKKLIKSHLKIKAFARIKEPAMGEDEFQFDEKKNDDRKIVDLDDDDDDIIIEDAKFKCGFCDLLFNSVANLKMHVSNIHESNKNYKCKFCEQVFGQSGTLKDHIINVHQLSISGPGCKCDKCGKLFSKLEDLKIHKKSAHDQLDLKVNEQNNGKSSGKIVFFSQLFELNSTPRARKFKKVQAKKPREIKYINFFMKLHFWQF